MLLPPKITSPVAGEVFRSTGSITVTWTPTISLCADLPGGDAMLCQDDGTQDFTMLPRSND